MAEVMVVSDSGSDAEEDDEDMSAEGEARDVIAAQLHAAENLAKDERRSDRALAVDGDVKLDMDEVAPDAVVVEVSMADNIASEHALVAYGDEMLAKGEEPLDVIEVMVEAAEAFAEEGLLSDPVLVNDGDDTLAIPASHNIAAEVQAVAASAMDGMASSPDLVDGDEQSTKGDVASDVVAAEVQVDEALAKAKMEVGHALVVDVDEEDEDEAMEEHCLVSDFVPTQDRAATAPVLPAPAGLFEQFGFHGPAPHTETLHVDVVKQRVGAKRARAGTSQQTVETQEIDKLPAEECLRKWEALAGPATSPDGLRLQLLIAAILHPKASETAVRACMTKLRLWADVGSQHLRPPTNFPRCLTAERLASSRPEELEEVLHGLHWHKTKAGRLVAAAGVLQERWGGCVPTLKHELITLPGVGPRLSSLLAFIFSMQNAPSRLSNASTASEGG